MAIIPFHIVDAFATHPFTGNPAAIIPNASSLTEVEMLQITDELSMEAAFVLPPTTPGADVRLRFFTRRLEANLSGHAAVAAFVSLADRGFYRPGHETVAIGLETGVGVLPVKLRNIADGHIQVTLEMPPPRFGEPVPATEVATALGVDPDMLHLGEQGPQRVSCGFDQIIVPVGIREVIRGSFQDAVAIGRLTDRRGVGGLTLFCPNTHRGDADFHCRFFQPKMGHYEDVASGTSLAAMSAYVVRNGILPAARSTTITTEQGHSLGRPTMAELQVQSDSGGIRRITLTGTGRVVMRGSFHFSRKMRAAAY